MDHGTCVPPYRPSQLIEEVEKMKVKLQAEAAFCANLLASAVAMKKKVSSRFASV